MGVPYDEIYISTRREIEVCRDKIRELQSAAAGIERRSGMTPAEYGERCAAGEASGEEAERWRECRAGIASWKERLKALEDTLEFGNT